ncbi:MAG: hypothetical protein J6Z01_13460 [Bacteroidales bacterium]|nr:hypothetical protein [Bacteroidales bacterium]
MQSLEKYNLSVDPFMETLKTKSSNTIWLDIFDAQKRIENIIIRYASYNGSNIILNYGQYGNGKSYTAKYFCSDNVLRQMFDNKPIPFVLFLPFPQNQEPIKHLFYQIIDLLDFVEIKNNLQNNSNFDFCEAAKMCSENPFFQDLIITIFTKMDGEVLKKELKLYLYNNLDLSDLNKIGIIRYLISDSDYINFLIAFFNFITYKKTVYPCVNLWLDDAESMWHHTIIEWPNIRSFFQKIVDNSFNLHIFLNYNTSLHNDLKELGDCLETSVTALIHQKIEFNINDSNSYKQFLFELLNKSRITLNDSANKFFPFTEEVINNVICDLAKNISLRRFSESFSTLLESAIFDNISIIDNDYYQRIKNEIIGCSL